MDQPFWMVCALPYAFIILPVDAETVNKLLEINRTFYARFSAAFSDSRSGERLNIEPFRKYLANDIRLLDAGCGNGRLAETLDRAGFALDYVGIDGSQELLAVANSRRASLKRVRAQFYVVELTLPGWSETPAIESPFDVIVSLAVLHHIPSFELRANVLREMRRLLKLQGILVMSNWQFTRSERLRKKIVAWEKGGEWDVERGDYLLDWKRGGEGYRYVHLLEPEEAERLAQETGFRVVEQFYADGGLNLFSIMQGG